MIYTSYKKLAILICVLILAVLIFVACSLGAGRGAVDPAVPTRIHTPEQMKIMSEYMDIHLEPIIYDMERHFEEFGHGPYASAHLQPHLKPSYSFEMVATFENILPDRSVELWQLYTKSRAENPESPMWEMYTLEEILVREEEEGRPCEDAWNFFSFPTEPNTTLIFAVDDYSVEYFGEIPLWISNVRASLLMVGLEPFNVSISSDEQEPLLRELLEFRGSSSEVAFIEGYYRLGIRYFDETGNTWRDRIGDFQFTVLQPVIHGEGGIWYAGQFADRNMTYFINLQREFDAGYAPWRTDPVEVVRVYLEEHFAGRDLRLEGSMGNIRRRGEPSEFFDVIREIPAFARPDTTPLERFRSNPPFPRLLHDATATAMNLGMWWGWRDGILEELGGLAFNEAYQFNCDYGLYYVITGWRHLETAEELARYFPQWNLPQYVGDFQLVGISVNDGLLDNLRVYHGPLYQPFAWSSNTPIYGLSTEPSPTGEVFIHDQIGFAFFAMYANESGDYVGLGVSSPIFELHETWLIDDVPFSAMEYGGGEILLRRQAGEYFLAVHDTLDITNLETPWVYVSLTVHHSPELPHRYFGYNTWNEQRDNFSQLKRVPREQLEELVRIFNPVEMFAQYQWFAHGWQ